MNGESSRYDDKLESMLEGGNSEPHNVPLEYLRNITNNFSVERLLGEGGFGTVYKVLHNWSQRKRVKNLFGVSLEVDHQQIRRFIQIGLDCVKTDRSKRPTISKIIKALHRPESADSSNIKGVHRFVAKVMKFSKALVEKKTQVHRPQSGKGDGNNEEKSWMERLATKHAPSFSIYETFTVALHRWQKKTALRRIRVIFTAVVFFVLLKRRGRGFISSLSDACSNSPQDALVKFHFSHGRKNRVKRTIRVPAISSKIADIPPDENSWRKYYEKPIKDSPDARGYYKCSTVQGCPARKQVEHDTDDPTRLVVTYEGEHCHTHTLAGPIQWRSQDDQVRYSQNLNAL